ncbi:MAG TPA: ABC transporter substrate-binding protein [Patescibacteria group bacterium]|nr:ABC transporter substrate-binding protein [Gammaproteobacteria bacterium]HWA51461.1 ABC transporter substrate-binding protein [Patescibacteria group bacterium]
MLLLSGCRDQVWNNPHPLKEYGENVRFGSFDAPPKTLDPAQSYSVDEQMFIAQVYEPPLQYHYLKRPYTLIPLTARSMPVVRYWDTNHQPLPSNALPQQVAFTTYDITIQPGVFYQPHPAFAKDAQGNYRYHHLSEHQLRGISQLGDFPYSGTRELTADDYVYEIKRLALPDVNSPILGLMSGHILGLTDYAATLRAAYDKQRAEKVMAPWLDLRNYPLAGAQVLDKYTYRITLIGQYRQFIYWLALSFFAPVPWEADYFYSQPGMARRNINFSWYPIGTGAYMLTENNPNKQMVLERNPNFHAEYYPTEGEPGDKAAGYLTDAGKRLPFVDKYVFSLEKEPTPRWNKFLQGYYDQSAIGSDNFGEAIAMDAYDKPRLTSQLLNKGIQLRTSVEPSSFYYAFNMLDDTVGGYSKRAKKLRLAISIALNEEELISIFLNGRGIAAQGPIPPGIFGYISGAAGINPYVYDEVNGEPVRKSLETAKKLLAEAGYPNGRDAQTGKPLILRYDTTSTSPVDKDQFDWMRKQFARLGLELNIEAIDYNRFQDKVRGGDVQFFPFGWIADYPDPENFLFLLYGPNSIVKNNGVNNANYANPQFDALFNQMKGLENTPQRLEIIQNMVGIAQADSPWVWGVFPKTYILSQAWIAPIKPNPVANNILKYQRVDPALRVKLIVSWNRPVVWPFLLLVLVVLALVLPVGIGYWRKIHRPVKLLP